MMKPRVVTALAYIINAKSPDKLVTDLYRIALSERTAEYAKPRLAWQSDLAIYLTDQKWQYCCSSTKRISLNGRHRLIHFKFLRYERALTVIDVERGWRISYMWHGLARGSHPFGARYMRK